MTPNLPDLITVDCPKCYGYGCFEDSEQNAHECPYCYGSAVIEVCSSCFQPPEIVNGLESCGCVVMAKAA